MGPLGERLVSPRMWALLQKEFPDRSATDLGVQLEECLKFLTIASESGACFIPLGKEVDEIWHALIVQTRSYAQLCADLPGGEFIHHESLDVSEYTNNIGRVAAVREFIGWVPLYVSRFGDFTEDRAKYWQVCNFLRVEIRISLDQINELGRTSVARNAVATLGPVTLRSLAGRTG
jgi:hypothetical protein